MERETRGASHNRPPDNIDTAFQCLLERVAAGIAEAETQLDQNLRARLLEFLAAVYPVGALRHAGGADDVAQKALVRLFARLRRGHIWFANLGALERYLHKIARNCVNAALRYPFGSRRGDVTLDVAIHDRPGAWSDPAKQAAFADWYRMASARLPTTYADMFASLAQGQCLRQFAAERGICLRTAERLRQQLRVLLANPYGVFLPF